MPKVLIANGSDEETWYFGQQGSVFEVDDISSSTYLIKGNHLKGVRVEDGELLYTEAEYNGIQKKLDQAIEHKRFAESVANQKINECNKLRRQHDKAIDDLAKHAKELAGLKEEKRILLETIEKAAGEQPLMELPREVVDALQSFFDDGYDIDHIVKCLLRISPGDGFPRLESIREYAVAHGYEFICALAYGYTAEKTPEERLSNEIEEIILDWHEAPRGEVSVLTQRIVDHLKSIQT
ncbi:MULTISPECIES: hypothetical protein [unclassified Paenibacillus]|uniref:hypothetical protein n=1 Tax=unclassified Paenibacillus TaxID=185978 RepID=UPI0030FB1D0D